jgi:hypothetical protein
MREIPGVDEARLPRQAHEHDPPAGLDPLDGVGRHLDVVGRVDDAVEGEPVVDGLPGPDLLEAE